MREISFQKALEEAVAEEMRRDSRVITMGTDFTGDPAKEFGPTRVRFTPISEAALTGMGLGAAGCGFRPIVNWRMVTFSFVAMDQIVNQASKIRYMFGGQADFPVTYRCTTGGGIGLAAQQVGKALQLTVLDISQVQDRPSTLKLNGKDVDPATAMPLVLINPEIEMRGESEIGTEGCLSFPEISGQIERAKSVAARALTLEGSTIEFEASGLLARAIQHEVDHLNGILFIDRMSSAAKAALSSRLKRLQKETKRGKRLRPEHERSLVAETTL